MTLPGTVVGMLLGGATPLEAGAVRVLVLAVEHVAAAVAVELVARGRIVRPALTAGA